MTDRWVAPRLVGRDEEVRELERHLRGVAAGRGHSVWIDGEPGSGKSALLSAATATARGLGCQVRLANAEPAHGRLPLRTLLAAFDDVLAERDPIGAVFATPVGTTIPPDLVAAATERVVDTVERLCATQPVVLVLDDAHWADGTTLAVWRRLHHSVDQLPLLLLAASRPAPARPELATLRHGLADTGARVVALGVLRSEHVDELLATLVGGRPGPALRGLVDQAGGNPLYITELADSLRRERLLRFDDGRVDLHADGADRVPRSLAAAISNRLDFLTAPTLTMLRTASLLGGGFSVGDLAVLSGQPPTALAGHVTEALATGVLAEAADRMVFRHELIRQALYEAIPRLRRESLHLLAAEALAGAGAPVEHTAHQILAAAGPPGPWSVPWLVAAADTVSSRAPDLAVRLLERVGAQLDPADVRRQRLDATLIVTLMQRGRYADLEPVARALLARTRDPDVTGQAAWTLGYTALRRGRYQEVVDLIDRTLRLRTVTPRWLARLRSLHAMLLVSNGRHEEVGAVARRAAEEATLAGDRLAHGYAIQMIAWADSRRDYAATLASLNQALAIVGDDPECVDLRLLLKANQTMALSELGRHADADRELRAAIAEAELAGLPVRLASLRINGAQHWTMTGRWDDALAELEAVTEAVSDDPARLLRLNAIGAFIAAHRADRRAFDRFRSTVDGVGIAAGERRYYAEYLLVAGAVVAESDGDAEAALATLRSLWDAGGGHGGGDRAEAANLWLPDVVRLALLTGEPATARSAAHDAARAVTETPSPGARAAEQHCAGLLADDPEPILTAADGYAEHGLPLWRGKALEDAAVLLTRRGRLREARPAYRAAAGVYMDLHATADLARLDSRLAALGVRRAGRTRERASTGWAALTPSELRVAGLVAEGLSNPDISARLVLSRRTVQVHVANILAKLGARSRVEIARQVALRARSSTMDGQ